MGVVAWGVVVPLGVASGVRRVVPRRTIVMVSVKSHGGGMERRVAYDQSDKT